MVPTSFLMRCTGNDGLHNFSDQDSLPSSVSVHKADHRKNSMANTAVKEDTQCGNACLISFTPLQQRDQHRRCFSPCRLLELPPTETLPSAVDSYEKAIVLSGMSKSMGMAGIRLGWLVTKDAALYKRLQLLHDYYSICHTGPSEVCLLLMMTHHFQRLIDELHVLKYDASHFRIAVLCNAVCTQAILHVHSISPRIITKPYIADFGTHRTP